MVYYKNYVDTEKCVRGVCLVTREHGAHPHHHPVDEVYELVCGRGLMRIGNTTEIVEAPYTVRIPGGVVHTINRCNGLTKVQRVDKEATGASRSTRCCCPKAMGHDNRK